MINKALLGFHSIPIKVFFVLFLFLVKLQTCELAFSFNLIGIKYLATSCTQSKFLNGKLTFFTSATLGSLKYFHIMN